MIPPMGLNNPAVITVMSTCSILTNANTCPMELELPSAVKSYEHFCNEMDLAITSQATGYGVQTALQCALKEVIVLQDRF